MTSSLRRALAIAALGISVLALLGLLLVARLPDTHGWGEAENWGHLPLFGVLALILLGVSRGLFPTRGREGLRHYLLAFAGAALLGALSELLQGLAERDLSAGDWARDLAGAALFLGLAASFDLRSPMQRLSPGLRHGLRAALVAAFLATGLPVAAWALAYAERDRAFPLLLDFESSWESSWERRLLTLQSAELIAVPPPAGWPADARGARVGKLTFSPEAATAAEFTGYSGFFIDEPYPDWRGYRVLSFLVFSELSEAVPLSLRIEDVQHQTNNTAPDRFNLEIVARPGLQEIRVPLEAVARAPATRRMDMSAVRIVHLFVIQPKVAFSVYVDAFRLE